MYRKKLVFTFLLFLNVFFINAQSNSQFSVGFEFGSNSANASLSNNWPVRQDVGAYYYNDAYNHSQSAYINNVITYVGVKTEYLFAADKLSLSSGLRFSNIYNDISKATEDSYFYLRYNSSGTTTEYARVFAITESNNYLGIPLELRIIPLNYKNVSLYCKLGAEFNVKLSSNIDLNFKDASMESSEADILNEMNVSVNNYYSTLNSAIGLRIRSHSLVNYNIEVLLPSFFITENNASLVSMDAFSGIQFSMCVPVSMFAKSSKK